MNRPRPLPGLIMIAACHAGLLFAQITGSVQLTLIPDTAVYNRLDITLIHTGLGAGQDTDETIASGTVQAEFILDDIDPENYTPRQFRLNRHSPGRVNLSNLHWQWSYLGSVNVTSYNLRATGSAIDDLFQNVVSNAPGEYHFASYPSPVIINDGEVWADHWLIGNSREADLGETPLTAFTSNATGIINWTPGVRNGLQVSHGVEAILPIDFDEMLGADNRLLGIGSIKAIGTLVVALSDYDGDSLADFEDPDDDNDKLPDAYENQFTVLNPFDKNDARTDHDHDNMTAWEEYIAGTDPTNANSTLMITGFTPKSMASNVLILSWPSSANRQYTVWRADNVYDDFTILASNLPARPPSNAYTTQVDNIADGYFRIEVEYNP